jgi:hypothetical protein
MKVCVCVMMVVKYSMKVLTHFSLHKDCAL